VQINDDDHGGGGSGGGGGDCMVTMMILFVHSCCHKERSLYIFSFTYAQRTTSAEANDVYSPSTTIMQCMH